MGVWPCEEGLLAPAAFTPASLAAAKCTLLLLLCSLLTGTACKGSSAPPRSISSKGTCMHKQERQQPQPLESERNVTQHHRIIRIELCIGA